MSLNGRDGIPQLPSEILRLPHPDIADVQDPPPPGWIIPKLKLEGPVPSQSSHSAPSEWLTLGQRQKPNPANPH